MTNSERPKQIDEVIIKESLKGLRNETDKIRESIFFEKGTDLSIITKIKILFSNKCFVLLILATFFRFMAGYSLGFFCATFYEKKYPD